MAALAISPSGLGRTGAGAQPRACNGCRSARPAGV